MEKPNVVAEVQTSYNSDFGPVNVVYKSMIRALVNLTEKGETPEELNLAFADQIERLYYFDSSTSRRNMDPNLGARLDSIVKQDNYTALSEVRYQGKTYGAYIKNKESVVYEIMVLQQSTDQVMLVSVLGQIKLDDVLSNVGDLQNLLNIADNLPI